MREFMDCCKYGTRVIFEPAIISGYFETERGVFGARGIIPAGELIAADEYVKQIMQDRIAVYLKSSLRRIRSFPTCSISGKSVELIIENESPCLLGKFHSYFICRDCEKNRAKNKIKDNNSSLINFTGTLKNESRVLAEGLGHEIVGGLSGSWRPHAFANDNKTYTTNGGRAFVVILPS